MQQTHVKTCSRQLTWISLALLKKYKELPHRQVHSRLDACHIQRNKDKYGAFPPQLWISPFSIAPTCPVPRGW